VNTASTKHMVKDHMTISIDEGSLWQNSASFHGKSSEETGNKRNVSKHNKGYL
jgi:hypothetical protein